MNSVYISTLMFFSLLCTPHTDSCKCIFFFSFQFLFVCFSDADIEMLSVGKYINVFIRIRIMEDIAYTGIIIDSKIGFLSGNYLCAFWQMGNSVYVFPEIVQVVFAHVFKGKIRSLWFFTPAR